MLTRAVKLERVTAESGDDSVWIHHYKQDLSLYALSLDQFFFVNLLTSAALKVYFWII